MTIYSPSNDLVQPIIHAIADIIRNQIDGVSYVYEEVPDTPPEDASVVLPLQPFKVLGDTNGKLYLKIPIAVRFVVRRGSFAENIAYAYTYIAPFLKAFSAWENQTLGGLAQSVSPTTGGVAQIIENGTAYVCLVTVVEVLTEYNIPIS